jgi:hypothetical protein
VGGCPEVLSVSHHARIKDLKFVNSHELLLYEDEGGNSNAVTRQTMDMTYIFRCECC